MPALSKWSSSSELLAWGVGSVGSGWPRGGVALAGVGVLLFMFGLASPLPLSVFFGLFGRPCVKALTKGSWSGFSLLRRLPEGWLLIFIGL